MTFESFKKSLSNVSPPADMPPLLLALWYDAKGEWQTAHEIAQSIDRKEGSLVHAYLHRKEGDEWNASYWYNRAGRKKPKLTLDEEWEAIAKELILCE